MSAAKTIFAITFILSASFTLIIPTLPPAQSLYEYARIPQTTLYIWQISVATLLTAITNGFFWTIIVAAAYGLVQLALHARRPGLLPPMPVAPYLATPPPENPLVDERIDKIPPALTIPPNASLIEINALARIMRKPEPTPVQIYKVSIEPEQDIETIEGIGPVCSALLRNSGIATVSDLLRVGATERGRRQLANEAGVTYTTILRWIYRGDLLRVKGIGRKYATLLEIAGVNTVTDLSTKNPYHLYQTLKSVNRERTPIKRIPPAKTIETWVRNAKTLEPILVE